MINISTKYTKQADFIAILVNKNSNLSNLTNFADSNSLKNLRDKASKNKKGFTFISSISKNKFKNLYFFYVDENKLEFEHQNLGGLIVSQALALKKIE